MEIGPVPGVRILAAIKTPPTDPRPPAVFDIANAAQPGDETYAGSGGKSAGGQDAEDGAFGNDPEAETVVQGPEGGPTGRINCFA